MEWTVLNEKVQIAHTLRAKGGKLTGSQNEMNILYQKYALFSLLKQLQNAEQALEHSQELHSKGKYLLALRYFSVLITAQK